MAAAVQLRLIGTTDVHARIAAYDYYRDRPDNSCGLAKAAALIAEARREVSQQPRLRQWRPHPGFAARRLGGRGADGR